jgi:hypothetical protein
MVILVSEAPTKAELGDTPEIVMALFAGGGLFGGGLFVGGVVVGGFVDGLLVGGVFAVLAGTPLPPQAVPRKAMPKTATVAIQSFTRTLQRSPGDSTVMGT